MTFLNENHESAYNDICSQMKFLDCYHRSFAYLIALDTVLREHIGDVFDFQEDVIKPECLSKGWQTGTSRKSARLAFNLWNGYCYEGENLEEETPSSYYTAEQIFNCPEYAPYYWEAVKLRFSVPI